MKSLITGFKGQLGYDIKRELIKRGFNNIIALDKEEMDITNKENVFDVILKENPDVIFHCAAWTNVEKAEELEELVYNVNVSGTKYITEAAERINAKIIYISTDYIFDGTKDGLYEIDDIPNPISVYGKTKYLGEQEVMKYDKHFIVRISWVFGINGSNFIKTMLKLSQKTTELNIVGDQHGSPTYTLDLARLLVDMSQTTKYGTYHATNEEYCSWVEFAKYIFEINNINVKVNSIKTSEYPTKAFRPLNSKLSKKSLTENNFEQLPSWKDAVERFQIELEKEVNL
ncbi:MAG: dTDP-4-dehydrorhamnose reductase [Bacilli bacterium]